MIWGENAFEKALKMAERAYKKVKMMLFICIL
jgi:hypothetical protein